MNKTKISAFTEPNFQFRDIEDKQINKIFGVSEGSKHYGEYDMKGRVNNTVANCLQQEVSKITVFEVSQTLPWAQGKSHLLLQMKENLISFVANTLKK